MIERGHREIGALFQARAASDILDWLDSKAAVPAVIAIDAPPLALRSREETRATERALTALGFRMQWTRRQDAPEWMENGQRLWEAMRAAYPGAAIIETFPTAIGTQLADCRLQLPLSRLAEHHKRRDWKDLVDACLCADVALRILEGLPVRVVGLEPERDELGPIYF